MDIIYKWIGTFLGWIDGLLGNYLFALLVFALIIELLLLPFSLKQQKNSQRQARLRPKEMAIRKKYAGRNDQATQQKVTLEIQELYKQENFSPLAGCLPMLLQLPIILIIYQVVINPLEHVVQMSTASIETLKKFLESSSEIGKRAIEILGYDPASTGGSIRFVSAVKELGLDFFAQNGLEASAYAELSQNFESLPNFTVLGLNLGLTPKLELNWLLIVPILTFVVYFLSMKLNRKFMYQPSMTADDRQAACSNNIMDFMMPIMSIFISFGVPAAVGVYWIFKSIIGTAKQFVLSRVMPLPKFTEEDVKAAERELKGKAPKQEPRALSDKPVRSLHSIDDDDDEPYPTFVDQKSIYDEKPENRKPASNNPEAKLDKKGKKGSIISAAPVKDENDSESTSENNDNNENNENNENSES